MATRFREKVRTYPRGRREPASPHASEEGAAISQPCHEPQADRILNLHGDVCPITFAKTKIALEEMAIGEVLLVQIDYEPAVRNVPRSVAMYGDEVLAVRTAGPKSWEILIRKRVE